MEYKNPIEVSPNNYRLLLEDGDYRLVEMSLPAGTSDIEHTHPNEMVYFITGGKVRIHNSYALPWWLEASAGCPKKAA